MHPAVAGVFMARVVAQMDVTHLVQKGPPPDAGTELQARGDCDDAIDSAGLSPAEVRQFIAGRFPPLHLDCGGKLIVEEPSVVFIVGFL